MTEPEYLRDLIRVEKIRLVQVEFGPGGASPKTIVERAVAMKKEANRNAKKGGDSSLNFDEVWCVFDVDEHPKLHDAKQQAAAHKIGVAISNPCFELWVLLHLQEQSAHMERRRVQALCAPVMKGKRVNYQHIRNEYAEAVRRATALHQRQCGNGCEGENPTTLVFALTEALHSRSRSARLAALAKK